MYLILLLLMCNSILVTVLAANANYGFCSPVNNTIIRSGVSKSCVRKGKMEASSAQSENSVCTNIFNYTCFLYALRTVLTHKKPRNSLERKTQQQIKNILLHLKVSKKRNLYFFTECCDLMVKIVCCCFEMNCHDQHKALVKASIKITESTVIKINQH